jgi:hypothetical protein
LIRHKTKNILKNILGSSRANLNLAVGSLERIMGKLSANYGQIMGKLWAIAFK